jgi:hypothetical protein
LPTTGVNHAGEAALLQQRAVVGLVVVVGRDGELDPFARDVTTRSSTLASPWPLNV